MALDYLASFPIPEALLPARLRALLEPVSLDPRQKVEVACLFEQDPYGADAEHDHLLMAVVPDDSDTPIGVLDEAGQGVVEYSVPAGGKGCVASLTPSISGYDYIVAAWGGSSFYSFNLAEKVSVTINNDSSMTISDCPNLEWQKARFQMNTSGNQAATSAGKCRTSICEDTCGCAAPEECVRSSTRLYFPTILRFAN